MCVCVHSCMCVCLRLCVRACLHECLHRYSCASVLRTCACMNVERGKQYLLFYSISSPISAKLVGHGADCELLKVRNTRICLFYL